MDSNHCGSILSSTRAGIKYRAMSGLLSFLLFGALFFVMMRFGCGAHVGHGGHAPQRDSKSDQTVTPSTHHALDAGVDPVCGMKVEPGAGYASVYQDQTVRFCSRDCLDKFEAQPERYLGARAMAEARPGIPGKRSVP